MRVKGKGDGACGHCWLCPRCSYPEQNKSQALEATGSSRCPLSPTYTLSRLTIIPPFTVFWAGVPNWGRHSTHWSWSWNSRFVAFERVIKSHQSRLCPLCKNLSLKVFQSWFQSWLRMHVNYLIPFCSASVRCKERWGGGNIIRGSLIGSLEKGLKLAPNTQVHQCICVSVPWVPGYKRRDSPPHGKLGQLEKAG